MGKDPRWNRIAVNCERCGKPLERRPSEIKKRVFCSKECAFPPHFSNCKGCGREFRYSPSDKQMFCSYACANNHEETSKRKSEGRRATLATPEGRKMFDEAMKRRSQLPYYQKRATGRARDIEMGRGEYRKWRIGVLRRDNWTCQECGRRGGLLQAHHIKSWVDYPELRYEVSNGKSLCPQCHTDEHGFRVRGLKTCPICSKIFVPHQMKQVCCSNQCSAARRKKAKPPLPARSCLNCKREFGVRPSDKRKYCCRVCYWQSLEGKPIPYWRDR